MARMVGSCAEKCRFLDNGRASCRNVNVHNLRANSTRPATQRLKPEGGRQSSCRTNQIVENQIDIKPEGGGRIIPDVLLIDTTQPGDIT